MDPEYDQEKESYCSPCTVHANHTLLCTHTIPPSWHIDSFHTCSPQSGNHLSFCSALELPFVDDSFCPLFVLPVNWHDPNCS